MLSLVTMHRASGFGPVTGLEKAKTSSKMFRYCTGYEKAEPLQSSSLRRVLAISRELLLTKFGFTESKM